jgi:hypothetical protein
LTHNAPGKALCQESDKVTGNTEFGRIFCGKARKKPGYPLQVLESADALSVGFPLLSLAQARILLRKIPPGPTASRWPKTPVRRGLSHGGRPHSRRRREAAATLCAYSPNFNFTQIITLY